MGGNAIRLDHFGRALHLENVKFARCDGCGTVAAIVGYWGVLQERHLCMRCDEIAWRALLRASGR